METVSKKLDNQLLTDKREDKQKRAKERVETVRLAQRESKEHRALEKRLKIADQELLLTKKSERELEGLLSVHTKENGSMASELAELRDSNQKCEREMLEKKRKFEARVLAGAKKAMRDNKGDVDELLFEKQKRDEYARQVIKCNKHLAVEPGLRVERQREMEERLERMNEDVKRARQNIKEYRKRRFYEKGFKRGDVDVLQSVFVTRSKGTLCLPDIPRAQSLDTLEIATLK